MWNHAHGAGIHKLEALAKSEYMLNRFDWQAEIDIDDEARSGAISNIHWVKLGV